MKAAEDFRNSIGKADQEYIQLIKQVLYELNMEDEQKEMQS